MSNSDDEMMPVADAVKSVIGKKVNSCTLWRWVKNGVLATNGVRVRLQVWKIGRSVFSTKAAVRDFGARGSFVEQR